MADKIKVVLADGTVITKSGFLWSTGSGLIVTDTKAGDRAMTALVAEVERLTQKCVDHEKSTDVEADYYNRLPEYMAGIMEGAHVRIVRDEGK